MFKRSSGILLKISLLLILAVFLAGCGKKQGDKVTVQFMMFGSVSEVESLKKYISQFEMLNPGIDVEFIHVSKGYPQKLLTMTSGGVPPDVFDVNNENFYSFVSREALLNIRDLMKNDQSFKTEDFFPIGLNAFEYKDGNYAVPWEVGCLALYYNRDLFDQAGIRYPDNTWTWSDFLKAAQKLTKDDNGDGKADKYGFVVNGDWWGEWGCFLWQNNGEFMDSMEKRCLLGSSGYIGNNSQAFQFLGDLVNKYKVAPGFSALREQGGSELFNMGRVGMMISGKWASMAFKDAGFKWDIAELPYNKKRATMFYSHAYAIAHRTKHPAEAWKLVSFLTSPEIMRQMADSGRCMPARKSVAGSKAFLASSGVPSGINNKAFLSGMAYARPLPTKNASGLEILDTLTIQCFGPILIGRQAKDVIVKLQPQLESMLEEK